MHAIIVVCVSLAPMRVAPCRRARHAPFQIMECRTPADVADRRHLEVDRPTSGGHQRGLTNQSRKDARAANRRHRSTPHSGEAPDQCLLQRQEPPGASRVNRSVELSTSRVR